MSNSISDQTVATIGPKTAGPSVVAFLRKATAYPDFTSRVELIETHISWVFLTESFVYKLKKPVQFEFLDFSSVEQRHAACMSELKLNRRLAPDVYLDVVPITLDAGGNLHLGGDGREINWVVKMKRLPAESSLDRLLEHKQLTERDVTTLGVTLAQFYGRLPPIKVDTEEYLRRLEHHVCANSDELAKPEYGLDSWLLKRLHTAQRRFLSVSQEALASRVSDGRIVDGHGDLRPEHIYFAPTPKVIDCLEFSQELRTIDIVDELAFLAMECERLGAVLVGQRVLQSYCTTNDDRVAPELVEFFKCYRACVRAKVNALRSRQVAESAATKLLETSRVYLRLADRSANRLGPPLLVVVRGLSGTGKSTVAETLAASFGCSWLQTDELRRQLFGLSTMEAEFNTGRYSVENRRQVYESMFRLAEDHLSHGLSVVLDGTFLTAESRRRAFDLAQAHQAVSLLVTCTCPSSLAMQRIRQRRNAQAVTSEARPEFVDRQRAEEEPNDPVWPVCTVDTSDRLEQTCQTIFGGIRLLILPDCTSNQKIIACESGPRDDLANAEFVNGMGVRPRTP